MEIFYYMADNVNVVEICSLTIDVYSRDVFSW